MCDTRIVESWLYSIFILFLFYFIPLFSFFYFIFLTTTRIFSIATNVKVTSWRICIIYVSVETQLPRDLVTRRWMCIYTYCAYVIKFIMAAILYFLAFQYFIFWFNSDKRTPSRFAILALFLFLYIYIFLHIAIRIYVYVYVHIIYIHIYICWYFQRLKINIGDAHLFFVCIFIL